jgi:hypothetical protein
VNDYAARLQEDRHRPSAVFRVMPQSEVDRLATYVDEIGMTGIDRASMFLGRPSSMRNAIISAAVLAIGAAAYGQGQFNVNFRGDGNDIRFVGSNGTRWSGPKAMALRFLPGLIHLALRAWVRLL